LSFSVLSYVALGFYFASFNITRQALAQSIVLLAYCAFVYNKRIWAYVLVLIAFSVHTSALIVLPFFLILKLKNKLFIPTFITLGTVALLFYNRIVHLVFSFETSYSIYKGTKYVSSGSNIINIFPSLILIAFVLIFRRRFLDENSKISFFVRLLFIGALFTTMSLFGIGFARISSYFWISSIVILPKLIESFSYREKPLLYLIVVTCMLIYMFLYVSNYGGIVPYVSVFSV